MALPGAPGTRPGCCGACGDWWSFSGSLVVLGEGFLTTRQNEMNDIDTYGLLLDVLPFH